MPVEPRDDTDGSDPAEKRLQKHAAGPGVEIGAGRPFENEQQNADDQGRAEHVHKYNRTMTDRPSSPIAAVARDGRAGCTGFAVCGIVGDTVTADGAPFRQTVFTSSHPDVPR